MTDADTGKNLGKCFQVVEQAYKEIDSLIQTLSELLNPFKSEPRNWNSQPTRPNGHSGWLFESYLCSIEIRDNFHLGFQISLLGAGMRIEGNDEPLLHVFKWYSETPPDLNEVKMDYPLDMNQNPSIWRESLIVWPSESEGGECQWTFSLRLASLTNKKDLENYIINPVKELLEKPTIRQFETDLLRSWDDWDGLVRYNTTITGELASIQAPVSP